MSSYVVPLTLISILYVGMLIRLWHSVPGSKVSAESRRGKKRVTRMVVFVVLAFAICWLPIHVSIHYKIFTKWKMKFRVWVDLRNVSGYKLCSFLLFFLSFKRLLIFNADIKSILRSIFYQDLMVRWNKNALEVRDQWKEGFFGLLSFQFIYFWSRWCELSVLNEN